MSDHRTNPFDPSMIRTLGRLDWVAHTIARGLRQGVHRSRHRAAGVEFSEFKPYAAGDDFRTLDWRLYARTQRLYVRRSQPETNLDCTLLLDASPSMRWRWGDTVSKIEYAANVLAALAYLLISQQDRVALLVGAGAGTRYLPPSGARKQLARVYALIESCQLAGDAAVPRLARAFAACRSHGGRVVLCSDLEEDPHALTAALPDLNPSRNTVTVLHLLDLAEVCLPFPDSVTHVVDSETGRRRRLNVPEARRQHAVRVAAFRSAWQQRLASMGMQYVPLDTGLDYIAAFRRILGLASA